MTRRGHVVADVLEATWQLAGDDEAWLLAVAEAMRPAIDTGQGILGFRVRLDAHGHTLGEPLALGGTDRWRASWRKNWWDAVVRPLDTPSLRSMLDFGAVSSAQQLWDAAARGLPTLDAHLRALSSQGWNHAFGRARDSAHAPRKLFYVDSLNFCALDPSGEGAAVIANREQPLSREDVERARHELGHVGNHLAAALRARATAIDALRRGLKPIARAEAVLLPDGRVLDASGPAESPSARVALREAARGIDRVRSRRARRSPSEALDLWRCVVDGRWSLVDEFESDGRRFVIAVPNEPGAVGEQLSTREGQVVAELAAGLSNKEIAYALGLAPSTVATLLARAAKKLGTRSRVELVLHGRRMLGGAPSPSKPRRRA